MGYRDRTKSLEKEFGLVWFGLAWLGLVWYIYHWVCVVTYLTK